MKKFLSMVLTLAMAMSFLTFAAPTAGAKSFSDVTDDNYKEAVEVISAIEVMDGYADATFGPTSTLTRQAAAKIICNMILGPTTARALPTNVNPFPDVQAGGEFAGYISYCADKGIISGYADGTFQPTGSLSGYAFFKMLLGALGYDAKIENYVGANWKVNVAKQALGIGLDSGHRDDEVDPSKIVTREEAALYMFNTLKADLVSYGDKITTQVGDAVVTIGNQQASALRWPTNSSTADGNIDGVGGDGYTQFAEQNFNKLERIAGNPDDFGRPSTRWDWKGVEIGTYKDTVKRTYHDNVKIYEMYNDMNMPGSDVAVLYVNGVRRGTIDFARGNDDELNDYTENIINDGLVGKGTVTEVFRDEDTNDVTICVISQYAGRVTSVRKATDKKDAYVVIEAFGTAADGKRPRGFSTTDGRNEYETTSFSTDDVVVYTYSDSANSIQDMYRMSSVEGSVTRRVDAKSVTLSGTTYNYAQTYTFDTGVYEDQMTNSSDFVVYLDNQGYAQFIENAEFAVDYYAALTMIETHKNDYTYTLDNPQPGDYDPNNWNDNRAHLIFTDGTERNVYLDGAYVDSNTNGLHDWITRGIVRYRVDNNGDYKLYEVPEENRAYIQGSRVDFSIQNRKVNNFVADDGDLIDADSKTIFVIQRNDDYRVYTGVRNAPNVNSNDRTEAYVYFTGNAGSKVAKLVVIKDSARVYTQSKDITFLSGKSASGIYRADDMNDYRVYNAVVAGTIKEVSVRTSALLTSTAASTYADGHSDGNIPSVNVGADGIDKAEHSIIMNVTNYDSDELLETGSFDHATLSAYQAQGIKTTSAASEVRVDTLNNNDGKLVTLANNANIYFCNADGDIEKINASDIETDEDDYVYYVEDDGDVTSLFICEYEPPKRLSTESDITALSYSVDDGEMRNDWASFNITGHTVTAVLPNTVDDDAEITLDATVSSKAKIGDDGFTPASVTVNSDGSVSPSPIYVEVVAEDTDYSTTWRINLSRAD